MRKLALLSLITLVPSVVLVACHASDDDAAGLAGELEDPVRREHAITQLTKLYSKVLSDNDGDRSSGPVQEFHSAVAEKLSQTFIDNRMDTQNTLAMLNLMVEMQEPSTLPALKEALDWRPEVSEEHAIRAAQAIRAMDVPDGEKAAVAQALGEAIDKVRQARPIDNRLRVEMLRTLGALETTAATPILTRVFSTQSETQPFMINYLAGHELGKLGDPEAVPELVKGLFVFDPTNLGNRLNSVATEALVRIGRPAYEPVLAVLRNQNEDARALAEGYIEAVRAQNEEMAANMSVQQQLSQEAAFVLGELGFRDAIQPLMQETQSEDPNRKQNAAIALVRLNHQPGDVQQVRETLQRVFNEVGEADHGIERQAQMLAAMQRLYDPELLDFFFRIAQNEEIHQALRLESVIGYARLANEDELGRLQTWMNSLDEDTKRDYERAVGPMMEVARECDEDVACYRGKLDEQIRQGQPDPEAERGRRRAVIEKAAFMLSRLARSDEESIAALIERLSDTDLLVRITALRAIDRIATEGSTAAVEKIDELREQEEGRNIWTRFKQEALPTQGRLAARAGS